jgi:hypothetical protein
LADLGLLATDQRVEDPAAVADLADEAVGVVPDPERAGLARVVEAVRQDLVDCEDEIVRALAEGGLPSAHAHNVACLAQPADRDTQLERVGGRLGQRLEELRGDLVDAAVVAAGLRTPCPEAIG